MAVIPLQVAGRSLDRGGTVQYPSSTPVADAFSNLGKTLQGVAERVQQKQDQHDGFKQRLLEQEFTGRLGGVEDQAAQSAPADASGLHDSVYGQIDPNTGVAVKPGSFDKLFDEYAEKVPESKREEFRAKREVYRAQGSARLARTQYLGEQDYYKVEIAKSQNDLTNAMLQADPNDTKTFEQFKQQQLELIDKSGLPQLEKDVARENWLANADETLFKAKLEKDPEFAGKARAALGLAVAGSSSAAAILRQEEGFRETPYWDVNHLRVGYGSDTITREDGSVKEVQKGDRVTRADAERDLARRTAEFERHAAGRVGAEAWSRLPGNVRAALVSVTYNYGELPDSVARAVRSGNTEAIASAVENLGSNKGRRAKEAAIIRGGAIPDQGADPAFANIPADRRVVLANQADVQVAEMQRTVDANMQAQYTSHKDALELSIVQGQTVDENLIANDTLLNDGDKATLIRSLRSQNETTNQLNSDLAALADGSLGLDPYASKDKTRADNIYADAVKRVPPAQQAAVASAIIEQTGVVPQPVVNTIRRGLSSTVPAQVAASAQVAQRISSLDPAALSRRDGGSEAQQAADDFTYFVDKLNLSPEDAARRMIDSNLPEKKQARKALEPAAKEFVKDIATEDLAAHFDDAWFSGDPSLGFSPGQELGIKAEFAAIAEDQFYASNGDPEIAKNRAVEQMKRLYGVTNLIGRSVVMKHPPEKYWPKETGNAGSLTWLGGDPFEYARKDLLQSVTEADPEFLPDSIQLVTTAQTDHDVKAGVLPGYSVLWTDKNGQLQTIPGKLWKPDVAALMKSEAEKREKEQQQRVERARQEQEDMKGIVERGPMLRKFLNEPENEKQPVPGANIPLDLPADSGGFQY